MTEQIPEFKIKETLIEKPLFKLHNIEDIITNNIFLVNYKKNEPKKEQNFPVFNTVDIIYYDPLLKKATTLAIKTPDNISTYGFDQATYGVKKILKVDHSNTKNWQMTLCIKSKFDTHLTEKQKEERREWIKKFEEISGRIKYLIFKNKMELGSPYNTQRFTEELINSMYRDFWSPKKTENETDENLEYIDRYLTAKISVYRNEGENNLLSSIIYESLPGKKIKKFTYEDISGHYFQKRAEITCVLEISSIFVTGGKVSPRFNLKQIKYKPQNERETELLLGIDDVPEETEIDLSDL